MMIASVGVVAGMIVVVRGAMTVVGCSLAVANALVLGFTVGDWLRTGDERKGRTQ